MGNRILLNDSTGRTTATFDVLNRPFGVQTSVGRMTMGYDPTSNRTLLIDPSGGRTSATFDNAGQPRSLLNPWLERTTWTFDPSGRVIGQALGNGTRSTLTYDSANQLSQIVNSGTALPIYSSFAYRDDPAGMRTAIIEAHGDRVSLTYDAANQLIQEIRTAGNYASGLPFALPRQLGWASSTGTRYAVTHTWDPAGNRVLKIDGGARTTATYDMANQLRYQQDSTGRTTFAFDGAGNMVLQNTATGGRTTQVWDGQNRLLQTLLPGATRNTYAYDGDGRRVLREDSTASASLIWDGGNVLQEVATAGGLLAQYTNGTAGYGPLISQRRSGASVFHLFDGSGSTNRLTDVYGNVIDEYVYDAFGEIRSAQGNPYRFIGQLGYAFDPDTVQYYLRSGNHDRPDLGVF